MILRMRVLCVLVIACSWSIDSVQWHELSAAENDGTFWSFRAVQAVNPPVTRQKNWGQSPIDQFILARLEEHGLNPGASTDRRTLLRRATFDLTGLPPTPSEINAFLADDSPTAFSDVIDRLLESPRYGERWGRHWLDVVRYADARDLIQLPAESDFREAWRYRDWVVSAFNRDLPYDQFIKLQIAGDLLQPMDASQIDAEALVATGMLAIADFVPGDVDKQQMIADYVNDQIDVVGRSILGLTLACARCHDHKFDPISTEDYYSLAGIFFSSRLVPGPIKGNTPLVRVPLLPATEIAAIESSQARDKLRVIELTNEVNHFIERECRSYLERQVETETERYLLAAWDVTHPMSGQVRPDVSEIAKLQGLDATALLRWIVYFDEKQPHPAMISIRQATEKSDAETQIKELVGKLSRIVADRLDRQKHADGHKSHTPLAILKFQADDRRIVINNNQHVTTWPNRGSNLESASPLSEAMPPFMTTVDIGGQPRPLLRFSGKELLKTPGTVPLMGSLLIVFRSDPAGPSGQRLIGWEDAAVGQHGLGMMTDGAGSIHAILRRNGANGDVVIPAPKPVPAMSGFQIVSMTWGPQGVVVYRDGQPVGSNQGIDAVSSDPAITSLMIGSAGSGSSSRFHGDLAELQVFDSPLNDEARQRVETELMNHWFSTDTAENSIDHIDDFYQELTSSLSPFHLPVTERDKVLRSDFGQRLADLRNELETLQKKPPREIPRAVVVQEGGPPGTPHEGFQDAKIYLRGNHSNLGKAVPRGFPKSIAGTNPPSIKEGSGRRELAAWLTSSENPLTSRVMVNRIWQHHFGVGLVSTSANLGAMGEFPSHPELLDYLATRFVESGWSVKAMHRLIMLSSVYQQTSASNPAGMATDPENRLLWRSNRRRLEAEAFRDNLFAVAGRLDWTPGGPGFQDVSSPRRGLYMMSVRTGTKTAEFGPLFDAPDCSGIVERRNESIVAPQALFFLNDPLVTSLARSLAERVACEADSGTDHERICRLYEVALGRLPTDEEIDVGLSLLADTTQPDSWAGYCRLILSTNEFLFVD